MQQDLHELRHIVDIEKKVDQALNFFIHKKEETNKEYQRIRRAVSSTSNTKNSENKKPDLLRKTAFGKQEDKNSENKKPDLSGFLFNFKQLDSKIQDLSALKHILGKMKNTRYV